MNDLDVYMSRLRFRLHTDKVPESFYRHSGTPFIDTPYGRILRPSLSRHRVGSGI